MKVTSSRQFHRQFIGKQPPRKTVERPADVTTLSSTKQNPAPMVGGYVNGVYVSDLGTIQSEAKR